jgi:glutamate:GABA antiporter
MAQVAGDPHSGDPGRLAAGGELGYRVPALGLLTLLDVVSTAAALVIGFVPPAQFSHSNPLVYAVLILAGILAVGILPPLLMDRFCKPGWKATGGPALR